MACVHCVRCRHAVKELGWNNESEYDDKTEEMAARTKALHRRLVRVFGIGVLVLLAGVLMHTRRGIGGGLFAIGDAVSASLAQARARVRFNTVSTLCRARSCPLCACACLHPDNAV